MTSLEFWNLFNPYHYKTIRVNPECSNYLNVTLISISSSWLSLWFEHRFYLTQWLMTLSEWEYNRLRAFVGSRRNGKNTIYVRPKPLQLIPNQTEAHTQHRKNLPLFYRYSNGKFTDILSLFPEKKRFLEKVFSLMLV